MRRRSYVLGGLGGGSSLILVGALSLGSVAMAQSSSKGSSISDAQVEANVLRALAGSPQLATQSIKTTTVYGTVTLSGTVEDETSRTLAETLASRAPGVTKVVDQLALSSDGNTAQPSAPEQDSGQQGAVAAGEAAIAEPSQGSTPQLQSDGTMAPADNSQQNNAQQNNGQQAQTPAPGQGAQDQSPEPGYISPPAPPAGQPQYPQQSNGQSQYPPSYPGSANGQAPPPSYRQPYPGSAQQGYPQAYPPGYSPNGQRQAPIPYGAQVAGKQVTIPGGAMLRVRLSEALSTKRTQPGTVFDGVVLNDVVADGEIAIPRGAAIQGTIINAKQGGSVGGKAQLALQLTNITLGGQQFPIVSEPWTANGPNTGGRTAGNVIGLGAFGALIGAVAGGGPGAAIGAVAGGAAGVGVSAAQGPGRVAIPAEAILTFHLAQPAGVTTVSQAEIERLGYGVPQGQMARRPPPPPGYYYPRPAYYPYPY